MKKSKKSIIKFKVGDTLIPKYKLYYTGKIIGYNKSRNLFEIKWTDLPRTQEWSNEWINENFELATKLDEVLS